jgi:hypothetical protein
VDFSLYIKLLKQAKFDGAFIAHGQSEEETPGLIHFLRQLL